MALKFKLGSKVPEDAVNIAYYDIDSVSPSDNVVMESFPDGVPRVNNILPTEYVPDLNKILKDVELLDYLGEREGRNYVILTDKYYDDPRGSQGVSGFDSAVDTPLFYEYYLKYNLYMTGNPSDTDFKKAVALYRNGELQTDYPYEVVKVGGEYTELLVNNQDGLPLNEGDDLVGKLYRCKLLLPISIKDGSVYEIRYTCFYPLAASKSDAVTSMREYINPQLIYMEENDYELSDSSIDITLLDGELKNASTVIVALNPEKKVRTYIPFGDNIDSWHIRFTAPNIKSGGNTYNIDSTNTTSRWSKTADGSGIVYGHRHITGAKPVIEDGGRVLRLPIAPIYVEPYGKYMKEDVTDPNYIEARSGYPAYCPVFYKNFRFTKEEYETFFEPSLHPSHREQWKIIKRLQPSELRQYSYDVERYGEDGVLYHGDYDSSVIYCGSMGWKGYTVEGEIGLKTDAILKIILFYGNDTELTIEISRKITDTIKVFYGSGHLIGQKDISISSDLTYFKVEIVRINGDIIVPTLRIFYGNRNSPLDLFDGVDYYDDLTEEGSGYLAFEGQGFIYIDDIKVYNGLSKGLSITRNGLIMDPTLVEDWDNDTGRIRLNKPVKYDDEIEIDYMYRDMYITYKDIDINPTLNHAYTENQGPELLYKDIYIWAENNSGELDHGFGVNSVPKDALVLSKVYLKPHLNADDVKLVDTRTRGGGIIEEIEGKRVDYNYIVAHMANSDGFNEIAAEIKHYWDIGYWDGKPYQAEGVIVVDIPQRIKDKIKTMIEQSYELYNNSEISPPDAEKAAEKFIEDVCYKHAALGSVVLVNYIKDGS